MINRLSLNNIFQADYIGAAASSLCLIHCLATPLLFVAQAGSVTVSEHGHGPLWWGLIDISLLFLSLIAIYRAVRLTSKQWMKYTMVISWIALAFIIFNEKLEGFHLPHEAIYIPAISLVFLHLYNKKYCQCKDDACCAID